MQHTEKFLVCIDPKSTQIYSIGLISEKIILEINVPIDVRQRVKNNLEEMDDLIDVNNLKWWYQSNDSKDFRKRKLPMYLLHPDSTKFPCFYQSSDLSLAFADVDSISLNIDLTEYANLTNDGLITKSCPKNILMNARLSSR